jgi:hypothetical protein
MNFFTNKVSLPWVILLPILTFILGAGFVWELRKTNIESGRLTLETARTSLELREKINKMMSEIIATDPRSPLWKLAVDNLNATEKGLAGIEGRPSITYEFKLPNPAGDLKVS